jgi:AcrR family transcriptional regulator
MSGMADKRAFRLGEHVTVTVPEAVADQVTSALTEAFGRRHGPQRGRARADRSPEERLSADRIVDVAIEQMRENGYDAVTMRSIAKALGTGPASLYAHVANRAELDQLVIGRVASQWHVPDPEPERWDDQLRQAMRDLLAVYQDHPGVARCSMGMIPTTASTLLPTERLLALMRAGGVPEQYAAWFVDVGSLYVGAVAVEDDIWKQRNAGQDGSDGATEDEVVAHVRQLFENLPEDHFPTIRAMAVALTTGSGAERFDFGVELLVGGLKALAERASGRDS